MSCYRDSGKSRERDEKEISPSRIEKLKKLYFKPNFWAYKWEKKSMIFKGLEHYSFPNYIETKNYLEANIILLGILFFLEWEDDFMFV